MRFTGEQQKVIDLRNRNILVSAAAGSGKTAVLVERILGLIMDEKNPVDVDRLLIVTFTNAAASEMRERIGTAIEKKLMECPDNLHLQRQATLLHHAQITTIDSFCLFVIKNNFNEIGLDPGFRVGDPGEIQLLKQDIINELFEEMLEKEETKEEFVWLLESIAYTGKEKTLEEAVLKIYEFAESFPWPKEWLQKRFQDYDVQTPLLETDWGKQWQKDLQSQLQQLKEAVEQALSLCTESDGPYMYVEALQSDQEIIDYLIAKSWQEQFEKMGQLSFARLSSKKDSNVSPEKKELVKSLRDEIKDSLGELKKKYFCFSPETVKKQMQEIARVEKILLETVLLFRERFIQKKREKNILDFSDMEHLALDILMERKEEADGSYTSKPSKVALDYRSYFKEIMVDEYQDSNLVQEYLLQSISGEEDGSFNRFMVGDLKQSIYKFRLARPEIFLDKYHTYSIEDSKQQRIDLHKNFRSRKQVIDSVNDIFYQIMGEELGQIDYTEKEALYPGASYEEGEEKNYQTELLLLEKGEEDDKKAEAAMVAQRIKQLVGSFPVTDKETGKLRPAKYGDIVILLRTNAGWDEEFCNVFMEYGIPTLITAKTGYFSAKEVQTLLSFLRCIDNPRQDIPLYGVMKSLFGRFTDEELVRLKGLGKDSLYENVKEATFLFQSMDKEEMILPEELCKKAADFLNRINQYRDLVSVTPIHKLLRQYLRETGYLYYVAGLPGGEQRVANIKMLLEKAESYEKTSYFGLFYFLRYMDQLQKYDIDSPEAGILDEATDAVRIMSIHKSKGLEFPICFVSGLAKKFNQKDTQTNLICDMDLGIGMDYRNPKMRVKNTDLRKSVIGDKMRTDNLGEELRVLYVAMTRAKEKLIMTSIVNDYEKQVLLYKTLSHRKERKLPLRVLYRGNCYLDYILAANSKPLNSIEVILWNVFEGNTSLQTEEIKQQVERIQVEQRISKMQDSCQELVTKWEERFSHTYAHQNLKGLYTKTSVSELKMKAMEEQSPAAYEMFEKPEMIPYLPAFVEAKGEVGATTRGNAYHRVMELMNFSTMETVEQVWDGMKAMEKEGLLDPSYLPLLQKRKIELFLQSTLAKRMQEADKKHLLYKEKPFVLGIPASILDEKFPDRELVLIQGIIDAYFEEDGELVVVDYKTDRVDTPEELVKRYEKQLEYYAKALEQLTDKKVKEKILYSFALGQIISL